MKTQPATPKSAGSRRSSSVNKSVLLTVCATVLAALSSRALAQEPLTVAEKSNYKATSRHSDVIDFCERLAKRSPLVRLGELGTSFEGRKLPLLILSDPPVTTAEEASHSGKPVLFAMGDIHAGEVDGKEGLLMLARDLATGSDRTLLKDFVLVFAPIFNADGNEKMSRTNRPGQVGPEEGMGVRPNGQGLDLNRDFIKLESPEVRSLVRFLNRWDPAMLIDTHTTNGSYHQYTITYDGPRNAADNPKLVELVRDSLLPEVSRRLEKMSGYKSFFYGNFAKNHTQWEPYPSEPRYGVQYVGLRNRIGILCESYSYAPYRDRVLASRDFVRSCLEYFHDHKADTLRVLTAARSANSRRRDETDGKIALREKLAPLGKPVRLLGFVEETKAGRHVATEQTKEYGVEYLGRSEPTRSVTKPYAYLFPESFAEAAQTLQRHGIEVEELREDIQLDVEVYRATKVSRADRAFQGHRLVFVDAVSRPDIRDVKAGTFFVRTGQRLGTLAAYLLEPQSADGLCTWNLFGAGLTEGQECPILRLPASVPITVGRVRPLAEDRGPKKPITFDVATGSGRSAGFGGAPVSGLTWLEDGKHFLQTKAGRPYIVDALSGRAEPFIASEKLVQGLSSISGISKETARSLTRQPPQTQGFGRSWELNPARTGGLFEHEGDLYYCNLDGTRPLRLTKGPGEKEFASFSPDGEWVAYVRDRNLYLVDLKTQTERALTSENNANVSNGKADWVYYEEIFNRHWKAFWWSPDSRHIAFLRFDDAPVPRFTVVDQIPLHQKVEMTAYPKAGDPNPLVKLGIASTAGGPVRWVEMADYPQATSLIPFVGWMPEGKSAYFYVQDRAQTWLDFCTVTSDGGRLERLFRETTSTWVNDPGAATFLKDGSFLLPSERTGWRHIYHFDKDGKNPRPITTGAWEVRTLQRVDEDQGWIYFSGMRDSPIATNLYRVKVGGGEPQRLTPGPGEHHVELSPKCNLFIDSNSTLTKPAQVRLYRADGALARTIDTNPVYAMEEYLYSTPELVQIKTSDGFLLEASVLKPPDFDARRRYPVWFMTYGGPHAPTISDSWSRSWAHDQMLAQMGIVVFRADPRSASGKGACSTWAAYRQFGFQELADIETAIKWLSKRPYIDSSRIGMSGHSYGGFMTAFALTHSKLFAAGIAGAPVTDWHDYDSIYTERYMNTPAQNPDGYEKTSVTRAAGSLHGKLLILHGLIDDNVHIQNTVQLILELQRANKDFEIMIYPLARHGIFGKHYQRLMVDFIRRTLGEPRENGKNGVTKASKEGERSTQ
jgi:dipeptidyl aminopeptidase/acylaminoacyl peptidase